jgi:hypothetical protein
MELFKEFRHKFKIDGHIYKVLDWKYSNNFLLAKNSSNNIEILLNILYVNNNALKIVSLKKIFSKL